MQMSDELLKNLELLVIRRDDLSFFFKDILSNGYGSRLFILINSTLEEIFMCNLVTKGRFSSTLKINIINIFTVVEVNSGPPKIFFEMN